MTPAILGAAFWVASVAPAGDRLAIVRYVSPHLAPPGWLELEDQIAHALAKHGEVLRASRQAEVAGGPGVRWDRARTRLAAALDGADAALAAGEPDVAMESLAECGDLLALPGVVAVTTAVTLRRCHHLEAIAARARGAAAAKRALSQYAALMDVRVEGDAELPPAVVSTIDRELSDAQPGGVSVDVGDEAAVYLDGVLLGRGDQRRYDLRPGRHYLRVVAAGRAAYGERLDLGPGEIVRRRVELETVVDPLTERGESFFVAAVAEPEAPSLVKLAREAGAARLLLLRPTAGGAAMRVFTAQPPAFGPIVSVAFDTDERAVQHAVARALGADRGLGEVITAVAIPLGPPGATAEVEAAREVSPARWWWLGGGAVAVAAVVVGIVLSAQGGGEPDRVGVWLCPGGAACAP